MNKWLLRFISVLGCLKVTHSLRGFQGTDQGLCSRYIQVPYEEYVSYWKPVEKTKSRRCGFLWMKTCHDTYYDREIEHEWRVFTKREFQYYCCSGYRQYGESWYAECKPECDTKCENGFCSSPETCSCNYGYIKVSKYICNPHCSKTCKNGKCINPEYCSCEVGYKKDINDKYSCLPICDEDCINGICTGPNICSCTEGYQLNLPNKYVCTPVCTEVCQNSKCTAPEVCSCHSGYEKDPQDNYKCLPVCRNKCINADCIEPEVCSCHSGYEKDTMDLSRCYPICHEICINSDCTAPDTCSCHEGFVKHHIWAYQCDPFCSQSCQNGFCSSPEVCTCYDGFLPSSNASYICEPVCSRQCVNSNCTQPETCSCWLGYQIDSFDKYKCEPVCSKKCINGECAAPETCECHEGYVHFTDDTYTCEPHCNSPCVNANCTHPDICECLDGYEKDDNSTNICHPVCLSVCQNGRCEEPEVCECLDGYEAYNTPDICVPVCSICQYGVCDAPDVCSCWEGYENPNDSNATCIPVCTEECINSDCTAPNFCTCREGYISSFVNQSLCVPYCSKACLNGVCTEPELCECLSGYEPDDVDSYLCNPICSEGCLNGICVEPEICNCLWGFQALGNNSNCSTSNDSIQDCIFYTEIVEKYENESDCISNRSELDIKKYQCPFLKLLILKYLHQYKRDHLHVSLECLKNNSTDDNMTIKVICSNIIIVENSFHNDSGTKYTQSSFHSEEVTSPYPDLYDMQTTIYDYNFSTFTADVEHLRSIKLPTSYSQLLNVTLSMSSLFQKEELSPYISESSHGVLPLETDDDLSDLNIRFGREIPYFFSKILNTSTEEYTEFTQAENKFLQELSSNPETKNSTYIVSNDSIFYTEELSTYVSESSSPGLLPSEVDNDPQDLMTTSPSIQQVQFTLDIDILEFIKREKITTNSFNGVNIGLKENVCICSVRQNENFCRDNFQLQLEFCRCENLSSGVSAFDPMMMVVQSSLTQAAVIVVLTLVCGLVICVCWKQSRKRIYFIGKIEDKMKTRTVHFNNDSVFMDSEH